MGNRLVDILQNDKNALKKFSGVNSKEDALGVAQGLIPGYTEGELLKDIQEIQDSAVTESSLSSGQLESVVGGAFNWGNFFAGVIPALIAAATGIFNAWNANRDQGGTPGA